MKGLEMFQALVHKMEGEDKVESQVVADGFKTVEAYTRNAKTVADRAKAIQMYETALKAAYTLVGRLFLEGKLNHVQEIPRTPKGR